MTQRIPKRRALLIVGGCVVAALIIWAFAWALASTHGVPQRKAFEQRCREQGLFLQTDRPYLNCVDGKGRIHSQMTG